MKNSKYGGSSGLEVGDGGEIYFNGGNRDDLESFDGHYSGEGQPLARTAGVHYDTKWDGDKQTINTNYKISSIIVDGTKNTLTQNNLPETFINSNSDQRFHNQMLRQKADAVYQLKIDTSSNLKLTIEGTKKSSDTDDQFLTTSSRKDSSLLNKNDRSIINHADQQKFNASIFYNKKFKKVGRTFSININESWDHMETKGYLKSEIDYFNINTVLDSMRKIDQYKTTLNESAVIHSNIAYSEPITKSFVLLLNYGIGINNSRSDRRSYNKSPSGRYDILDDTLSNNFKLNQLSNQVGLIFNYKKNIYAKNRGLSTQPYSR